MEPGSRNASPQHVIEFANFRLDPKKRKLLTLDGNQLVLNSRAFDTLLVLVEHRGEVLSKHQLLDAVWPKAVVEENNLNQAISALRRVLGDSNDNNRIILTIPGRGFCFVAEIRKISDKDANYGSDTFSPEAVINITSPSAETQNLVPTVPPKAAPEPLDTDFETTHLSRPEVVQAAREITRPVRKFQVVAMLFAVIIIIAALAVWTRSPPPELPPRLAVLMFENQSPDPENAFFAEGLHSEILSTLANRVSGMQVISRTTMRMYRNSDKSLQVIAGELNATHILEGAVFREGNRMRLTLQLIDGLTDKLLWSERYERTLTDALQLQAEVAAAIAGQLVVQLIGVIDTPTTDAVAYDLFLKARVARLTLTGSHPVEDWRRAETLLGEALARDPAFWQALVERASIRRFIAERVYPGSAGSAQLAAADLAAARAIAGDEPLILAAEAEAEPDALRALQLFETAEARGLSEPEMLWGKITKLRQLDRVPEALTHFEKMMLLDSGNTGSIVEHMWILSLVEQYEELYRVINMLANREPDNFQLAMHRAQISFMYTGNMDRWLAFPFEEAPQFMDTGTQVYESWKRARFGRQFDELRFYLNTLPQEAIRNVQVGSVFELSIAETPLAEYRGWSDFFLGDTAGAVNEGEAIFAYVARRQATAADAWYLRLLNAEGLLFTGEISRAIDTARDALQLAADTGSDTTLAAGRNIGAAILAWAGAHDEAVALLEKLANEAPIAAPAMITRDPLFNIPLATNPRFKVLSDRLEAEMAARTFE